MNNGIDKKHSRFVVFCIEAYKRHNSLSGSEVIALFERYNVTDYLIDGYDVLHSLGEAALMDDISDFIKRRSDEDSAH
jgi:hypothetical protein